MTSIAQKYNSEDIIMEALYSVMRYSYSEWIPTKVAARILQPVAHKLADICKPSLEQLLGYFEILVNKLIAYNKFGPPEISEYKNLEAEYEANELIEAKSNLIVNGRLEKLISLN